MKVLQLPQDSLDAPIDRVASSLCFCLGTGEKAGALCLLTEPWSLWIITTTREDTGLVDLLFWPSGMPGKGLLLSGWCFLLLLVCLCVLRQVPPSMSHSLFVHQTGSIKWHLVSCLPIPMGSHVWCQVFAGQDILKMEGWAVNAEAASMGIKGQKRAREMVQCTVQFVKWFPCPMLDVAGDAALALIWCSH